ncbi:glycosyl transferase [Salmonella enterica subsp. enterica serovar Choleraesuis]|nr:glycosyl transferase [Salmonella enterica subsp. enterica serovar Choleraesuis]
MTSLPSITVSIKTLNEAEGIEKTIDSVRQQVSRYPHQIIIADSLSTDGTRELALAKDAMVVCLDNTQDRCCGVGHQLGWLYSEGDYLLLLDGDMELSPGFLDAAVAFLEEHPEYAGVAGSVEMDDAANYEFRSRKQRLHLIYPLGDTDHLGGGGLYRRSAIEKIGYLTNRNLHGYEEAELGIRLLAAGYKLHRLSAPYFRHASYTMPTFKMLAYRWKNGFLWAPGELLRNAWGKQHFAAAFKIVRNELIFTIYLLLLLLALVTLNPVIIGIILMPLLLFIAAKAYKNKSLRDGIQSVINLSLFSAGLLRGVINTPKDPMSRPAVTVSNPKHVDSENENTLRQ